MKKIAKTLLLLLGLSLQYPALGATPAIAVKDTTICEGDTYTWRGNVYDAPGTYTETIRTKNQGNDSIIYELHLTIRPIPVSYVNATICRGSSYSFGDRTYTESGIYTHRFSHNGCDSVVTLSLNVVSGDTVVQLHEMAEGESYIWNEKEYTQPGTYDLVMTGISGCDSINRLILTTHHIDTIDTTAVICPGETLEWHGLEGRSTRDYTRWETLANGDIVYYVLHLTAKKLTVLEPVILNLCSGDSVQYKGITYYTAGSYDRYFSCDTLQQISIRQYPTYSYTYYDTIVNADSYTWRFTHNGEEQTYTYQSPGLYEVTLDNTETSCKDIYRLYLAKLQRSEQIIRFCDRYTYKGTLITDSKVIYDTLAASGGYDSIVCMRFNKMPSYHMHDTASISPGETLIWRGKEIKTNGVYTDEYQTVWGCDSVYELSVGLKDAPVQTPIVTQLATVCDGVEYLWRNHTYTQAGKHVDTVWKEPEHIVDSLYVLQLTVATSHRDTIYQHFYTCDEKGIFRFNGEEYTQDTAIITHYSNFTGCDSIVKTYLHFNTAYFKSDTLRITDTDTDRVWHNQKIDHTGTYTYDTPTEGGCINREELVVFIYPTFHFVKDTALCETELPYIWRDDRDSIETYFHPAGETRQYYHAYKTGFGADSIYELNLTVWPAYKAVQQIHFCEGDEFFLNGTDYSGIRTDSIYRDTVVSRSVHSCDSIIYYEIFKSPVKTHRETSILHTGDTIAWHGKQITEGGIYRDTVPQAGKGCDSISEIRVIAEVHEELTLCSLYDLPYVWVPYEGDTFRINISGNYTDTVYDENGYLKEYHSLRLLVRQPVDTTVYLRGCAHEGVLFNGIHYDTDTIVKDTLSTCDTIYTVVVKLDTAATLTIDTTLCELDLPYIFRGAQQTDTLWQEGSYSHQDTLYNGCMVRNTTLTLRIRPNLTKNDSVIVCEDELQVNPFILGDTVNPWFGREGSKYQNSWQGKWTGLKFSEDTVVWNCDSTYFFHIISRPRSLKDSLYTLCEGDSLRFGTLPDGSPRWVRKNGIYWDTVPASPTWTDPHNGLIRDADTLACDSLIRLTLTVIPAYRDTVEKHIPMGDSLKWGNLYYHFPGLYNDTTDYDVSGEKDSRDQYCKAISTVRLFIDSVYLYRDTISICELPEKTRTYTWRDGYVQSYNTPQRDTAIHYRDTLYMSLAVQHHDDRFDSIYDLFVRYRRIQVDTIHANVCDGDSVRFGKRMLSVQGTYTDTLTAANGCDSIVVMVLQVYPHELKIESKIIFEGQSVEFHGATYSTSGTYEYRMTNANGCFDVHRLILTVLPVSKKDTTAYVCENDLPYIWRGFEYHAQGDYTLATSTDSTRVETTLHLRVYPNYYSEQSVSICQGSRFVYKGKEYRSSCSFYDTIPTTQGCDSVLRINVSVQPTYDRYDTVHISDRQTYNFNGRILSTPGTYEASFKTSCCGCDSLVHIVLVVHPSFYKLDSMDMCHPDTLIWHGKTITRSGLYSDSALTSFGFDSVYQIKVKFHESYRIEERYEIVPGYTTYIHGINITQPGVYYDTLRSIHGCDSIFHIVVNEKRIFEQTQNVEICEGETYDFYGQPLTRTGLYHHRSADGAETIHLNLTVNPKTVTEQRVVVAKDRLDQDSYYIYNGRRFYVPNEYNVFEDYYTNQYGCDSIYRINIVVTQRYSEWYNIPLCPGSELQIDSVVITKAGEYSFLRRSKVTGQMDSLYRIEVYDARSYDMPTESRTICQGDTLQFGGRSLTRSGKYDFQFETIDGCDSLVHLDLKVNPTYRFDNYVSITDYQSYRWYNRDYYEAGDYERTFASASDCDSTYVLHLTVIPTEYVHMRDTICVGQRYSWRGYTFDRAGYYTDTVRVLQTGTSAIYTLELTTLTPTLVTSAEVTETCADAEGFDIRFTYSGAAPQAYSIYFDQLAKNEGFTDIIDAPATTENIAHVTLPGKTEVVYKEHTAYVRPDYYTMRLVLDNGVCGFSRSDSLKVLIKYPSWILEQNWNDVVAPLKPEYNGGYDFSQTDWLVNGVAVQSAGEGYLHYDALKEGDEVVMIAKRRGENYTVASCPMVIKAAEKEVNTTPVIVTPTQAPRHTPVVTIESQQNGSYGIWSFTGTLIHAGTIGEGKTAVTLPAVNGMYFIRTQIGNETETHKVVIY